MAAATVGTPDATFPAGPKVKVVITDITMNASYATGGDTADLSSHFATAVLGGIPIGDTEGYVLAYKPAASHAPATGTIQAYEAGADGAALDEVTATTDLSTGIGAHAWAFFGY